MALYVAICLLAALTVASHGELAHRSTVLKIFWGTTLGLALAHWFAFRLSSRLVASGALRRSDAEVALAQLLCSVVVAILATLAVLVFDGEAELDAAWWVMAAFIAVIGYWLYAAKVGWRPRILRVGTVVHVMPQPRSRRRR